MSGKIKIICRKVLLLLGFMLLFQFGFSQFNFSEVDKKLDAYQKDLGNNVAIMVTKDNKVIYKKEMGDFKINTPAPIASCSKWLTAAMVMTFVDAGKLNLDDKVADYIPIFKPYGKGYITIRHCLSHQTGIEQEPIRLLGLIGKKKYENLEEEVNDYASKKEIAYDPGKGFFYGGVGLNIAARVCEVIGKRQFEQLMNERIFRNLNMRATNFGGVYGKAPNPSGGAISTAADYSNFLMMILNKGTFNGKRILSEASVAEMQKLQIDMNAIKYAPKAGEGYGYGLGEWIIEKNSKGETTAVASPGLFGTWPIVDNCRGYTYILFIKNLMNGEHKRDINLEIKKAIDDALGKPVCN